MEKKNDLGVLSQKEEKKKGTQKLSPAGVATPKYSERAEKE